jgi:hypothetical protein
MLARSESAVLPEKKADEITIPEGPPTENKPRIEMDVSDQKGQFGNQVEIPVQGFKSFISGLNFHSGCTVNFNIHKS